jgi:hypothetical protein
MLRWIRKDMGLRVYLGASEMNNMGGHSETFSEDGPSNAEIVGKIFEIYSDLGFES